MEEMIWGGNDLAARSRQCIMWLVVMNLLNRVIVSKHSEKQPCLLFALEVAVSDADSPDSNQSVDRPHTVVVQHARLQSGIIYCEIPVVIN